MDRTAPPADVGRGLVAGLIGTATMTAWQDLSARLQSSGESESDTDSESASQNGGGNHQPGSDAERWEQAPAPARAARKLLGAVGVEVPADRIGLLSQVTHWGYGTGWGAIYGLVRGRIGPAADAPGAGLPTGLAFGTFVWAMSYVQLVPLGIYEPPWRYSPQELAWDLSYHLAYGAGLGTAYDAVAAAT